MDGDPVGFSAEYFNSICNIVTAFVYLPYLIHRLTGVASPPTIMSA